jgi:phage gpG-like protein
VAITVAELAVYWQLLADRLKAQAPLDAANAMAHAYQRIVVRSMHGPAPSPPGTPPARRTGTLARSVRAEPAIMTGAYSAMSSVAPHTVYARIQNAGGHIHIVRAKVLTDGRTFFGTRVYLPPRPYMVVGPEARSACHDAARRAVEALF